MSKSKLELLLAQQLFAARIDDFVREHMPIEGRRWRLDFAWPSRRFAVEVEGGIWISGRHNHPVSFDREVEKHNALVLNGWRVLKVTKQMLVDQVAVHYVREGLKLTEPEVRGETDPAAA